MKKFDLCSPRRYEVNGEEKTQWLNLGVVIEKDGKLFGELKVTPVNWDGKFQLFEQKPKEQQPTNQPKQTQKYNGELPF